jgi:2-polyprenyl-6-methoxyphenol hydroxylase-like FAD-dependent oxidoreductase
MHEDQTEVLVVGAGPVGLLTALLLAEAGIQVKIIDREERTTTRSYACALHPRVLRLLDLYGLTDALMAYGRKVETVAFYDGATRRAQIKLSSKDGRFPYLLILPQSALEGALEERLRQKAGVSVDWNHRFDDFQDEKDTIAVSVEKLGGTSTGYIVPHWETVVQKRFSIRARFLVGADGHNSLVRQRLGFEYARLAGPDFFAAYEFEPETPPPDEVRVVLNEKDTNVLWPLPGNKSRWTFQVLKSELSSEFPEKERRAVRLEHKTVDDHLRQYVQKVGRERAPWFADAVKDVSWCTDVMFEARLVRQFGRDRCWLAGDAAHQTGPVGAQSMNVGMCEAEALANRMRKILREGAPISLLQAHEQAWQDEWRRLLGMTGGLRPRADTNPWVRERGARLLSCLPGSGTDIAPLAAQLNMDV